ncbi:hypothetical protein HQ520_07085 [bacterium]|nr:hypothetical protein [bacterium]
MSRSDRLSSNLFLITTSLVIAFVIWMIAKRGEQTVETFSVNLVLRNVPQNVLAIVEPDRINITFPVPNRIRGRVQRDIFRVEYDFSKGLPEARSWCGIQDYRPSKPLDIEPRDIRILPTVDSDLRHAIEKQLQYADIGAGNVVAKGKLITRSARLVFPTAGLPPSGFHQAEPVRPQNAGTILLTASPARFSELVPEEDAPIPIETEGIDLTDHRETFTINVGLRLPEDVELVHSEYRLIPAIVSIEEVLRTIEEVSVVSPPSVPTLNLEYTPRLAKVTVRGPQEALDRLVSSNLIVHPAEAITPQPGLEISVPLQAGLTPDTSPDLVQTITVKSVTPEVMILKYVEILPETTVRPLEPAPDLLPLEDFFNNLEVPAE